MHCDMLGLAAANFILRIVVARMARISMIQGVRRVHLDDFAANPARFRIPTDVVSYLKSLRHGFRSIRC